MNKLQRFSFVPNPASGETVYSWISRYHLMSGYDSFRNSTLALLGVHEERATNEFPCFIPGLSQMTRVAVNDIINQMTPYHYFAPFLDAATRVSLFKCLETGCTSSLQSSLGMVANRITPGPFLYCCCDCIAEDTDKCGFPYWHVEHQLTGVYVCSKHHKLLHPVYRETRKVPILPESKSEPESRLQDDKLANLISTELTSHVSLNTDNILLAYKAKLDVMGFVTRCGRLRMKLLRQALKDYLNKLTPGLLICEFLKKQLVNNRYPECLFYAPNASHHPIKHLIMIDYLFGSWRKFSELVNSNIAERLTPQPTHVPKPLMLSAEAIAKISSGVSLRKVSVDEGLSVTTLKILAHREGLDINLRPSKIFKNMERCIWIKLMIGNTTSSIANEFSISVGAVEVILRKFPELITLRKRIRFYKLQKRHREALQSLLRDKATPTRGLIQKAIRASYTWLFKHDKEWLYKNLPAEIPREQRYARQSKKI
ncbi:MULTISPECIES: TnsD family Tn7-like transposition protein [unclassified Shewanella]|uniref:TnsD family Tn7-like transposition protein n=1 Tax=unclassified Shewanella TaxID=196818 RepID=UPI00355160D4